jgi:hypothetical protein
MKNITAMAAFFASFSVAVVSAQEIISELMVNPITVGKDKGTWFKFFNTSPRPRNISNLYITLGNYNASTSGFNVAGLQLTTFQIPVGFVIPSKSYFVFGNNHNRTTNGNVPVDYLCTVHMSK